MTTKKKPAPSDTACSRAWDEIAAIARKHALIVQAYGGTMTLAMPEEQRKAGLREQVLQAHAMSETEYDPCAEEHQPVIQPRPRR